MTFVGLLLLIPFTRFCSRFLINFFYTQWQTTTSVEYMKMFTNFLNFNHTHMILEQTSSLSEIENDARMQLELNENLHQLNDDTRQLFNVINQMKFIRIWNEERRRKINFLVNELCQCSSVDMQICIMLTCCFGAESLADDFCKLAKCIIVQSPKA